MTKPKKDRQEVPIEFQILYEKLDSIIGLLVANICKEKSISEKAFYLRGMGFTNKKIAELLSTTPNTVAVELYKYKKETRKRKSGKENISTTKITE